MPVPSLKELATQKAQKHIREVDDVGEMPWELVRPLVQVVKSHKQLFRLQQKSPHLAPHTGDKWRELLIRDFPSAWARDQVEPRNPASWWKVYRKFEQDYKTAWLADTAALTAAQAQNAAAKIDKKPVYVPILLPSSDGKESVRYKTARTQGWVKPPGPKSKAQSTIMNAVLKESAQARFNRRRAQVQPGKPASSSTIAKVKLTNNTAVLIEHGKLGIEGVRRPPGMKTGISMADTVALSSRLAKEYVTKHSTEIATAREHEKSVQSGIIFRRASHSQSPGRSTDNDANVPGRVRSPNSRSASVASSSSTSTHRSAVLNNASRVSAKSPKRSPASTTINPAAQVDISMANNTPTRTASADITTPSRVTAAIPTPLIAGQRTSGIVEVVDKDGKRKLERAPASLWAPVKRQRRV